jgi:hypothetical protein
VKDFPDVQASLCILRSQSRHSLRSVVFYKRSNAHNDSSNFDMPVEWKDPSSLPLQTVVCDRLRSPYLDNSRGMSEIAEGTRGRGGGGGI